MTAAIKPKIKYSEPISLWLVENNQRTQKSKTCHEVMGKSKLKRRIECRSTLKQKSYRV